MPEIVIHEDEPAAVRAERHGIGRGGQLAHRGEDPP